MLFENFPIYFFYFLALIPVLVYIVKKSIKISLMLIFLSSFSMGIGQAAGIPLAFFKLTSEFLSWTLLLKVLHQNRKTAFKTQTLLITCLISIALLGTISAFVHDTNFYKIILFIRATMSFIPLFIIAGSYEFRTSEINFLVKILFFLFFLQLPASWIKYAFWGVDEKAWIGTVHQTAGQFGLLIPIFAISFLASLYFYSNKKVSILLILSFISFAIICDKRAIVFVLPLWLFSLFALYIIHQVVANRKVSFVFILLQKKFIAKFLVNVVLITITFFSATEMMHSLNPYMEATSSYWQLNKSSKNGGFFRNILKKAKESLVHTLEYSINYSTRDYENKLNNPIEKIDVDTGIQMGRFKVTAEVAKYMLKQEFFTAAAGLGASATSTSYLLGRRRGDIMFEKFRIRGTVSSAVKLLIESGVLGLLIMMFWFIYVNIGLMKIFIESKESYEAIFLLGIIGAHWLFFFDFTVYSFTAWNSGVLSPAYFFLLGLAFRKDRQKYLKLFSAGAFSKHSI